MTIIHLARHGTHDEVGRILSGRSEIALNDAGRVEAEGIRRRFADVPLTAIHSSPRMRAWETAGPVAADHALPIERVAALDEIDFGAWRGQSFAELAHDAAWHAWNAARGSAPTPGGETMAEAAARAVNHIGGLAQTAGTFLCVTHCDVIRGVVAHYLGLHADRLLAFDVDPGSVTTLEMYDAGEARLVRLNERCA
jgi:broad specificity phosphatase PhoE